MPEKAGYVAQAHVSGSCQALQRGFSKLLTEPSKVYSVVETIQESKQLPRKAEIKQTKELPCWGHLTVVPARVAGSPAPAGLIKVPLPGRVIPPRLARLGPPSFWNGACSSGGATKKRLNIQTDQPNP